MRGKRVSIISIKVQGFRFQNHSSLDLDNTSRRIEKKTTATTSQLHFVGLVRRMQHVRLMNANLIRTCHIVVLCYFYVEVHFGWNSIHFFCVNRESRLNY